MSLEEIPQFQIEMMEKIRERFGENWQELRMPEPTKEEENEAVFTEGHLIRNTLYHPLWIPLMVCQEHYICTDWAPMKEQDKGQIIMVKASEKLETYKITKIFDDISEWMQYIRQYLNSDKVICDESTNTLKFAQREYPRTTYTSEEKQALQEYISKHLGEISNIIPDPYYEEDTFDIDCQVCIIPPTEQHDYYTLVTLGAGAYIANNQTYRTEILLNMPKSWQPNSEEEQGKAPIEWLRSIARIPIRYNTFLGHGYSITLNMEQTDFVGIVTIGYTQYDKDADQHLPLLAPLSLEEKVAFLALVPIYQTEMDYRLTHSSDELLDKFNEYDIPYPPVFDPHRKNTCPNYENPENPALLNGIGWAFGHVFEKSLSNFWRLVHDYNQQIEHNLDDYSPYSVIFNAKKVKVIYEAWIRTPQQLLDYEQLVNEQVLKEEPNADGLYRVQIIATCKAGDDKMLAIELLQWINNSLYNKELGNSIFFQGISLEGKEEDETPVVYLLLGE